MPVAPVSAAHVVNHGDAESLISLGIILDDLLQTAKTWKARFFPRYALSQCYFGTFSPEEWVIQQNEGVFILVLFGADEHVKFFESSVVIDAVTRESTDCYESHILMMEWCVLRQRVGRASFRRGMDARRLHRHRIGNKTCKDGCKHKSITNQIEEQKR